MWFEYNNNFRRYPAEMREITEIIASGRPKITQDDICDVLIDLWLEEKKQEDDDSGTDEPEVEGLKSRKVNNYYERFCT